VRVQDIEFVSTVNQIITEALQMKTNRSLLKFNDLRITFLRGEEENKNDKNELRLNENVD